jgi:hypothetical protein
MLVAEAKRRHASAADLLREFIETLPPLPGSKPSKRPHAARRAKPRAEASA